MYTGLKHFHSFWAYLVILLLAVALINALLGLLGNKNFTDKDRRLSLFALIAAHVQLLLGLILYFVSPLGSSNLGGDAMKNATARLYAVEHPLVMLIAIVLITVGYSRSKRLTVDKQKFRTTTLLYGLAFVLVLSRIPWSAWLGK
jgi:hypothetical protein